MPLKTPPTPSAECLSSVSDAVEYLRNVIRRNWPAAYPDKAVQVPVETVDEQGNPVVITQLQLAPDMEATQAFFDGLTDIIPTGGADICVMMSLAAALTNYAKAVDQGVMDTNTRLMHLAELANLRNLHLAVAALPITDRSPTIPPYDLTVNPDFSVTVSAPTV